MEFLTDYSPKDDKWDNHRGETDDVTGIYASSLEFERYAQRMALCSGYLRFAELLDTSTGELSYKLRKASFCRVRHCPVCQWRRSMMWQAKFFQALPTLQKEYPTAKWLFLTLTVRNCPIEELGNTLSKMNTALNKLTKRKEFTKSVIGWIRTTEVTKENSNKAHAATQIELRNCVRHAPYAHPHFHILLMINSNYFKTAYIKHARWVELWRDSLGINYDPNVDIRPIKTSIETGALEVLKYAVKPADMVADRDWFLELTRQLVKRRFIGTGGVLKDLFQEKEQSNEELIFVDGNEEPQQNEEEKLIGFNWNSTERKYKRSKSRE